MSTVSLRFPIGMPGGVISWEQNYRSSLRHARHPQTLRIRPVGSTDPRISGVKPLSVPFAPIPATMAGLAPVFTRSPRPGRSDAVSRQNNPTPTLAFDLYFAHNDYRQSSEPGLQHLERLAKHDDAVVLQGYGPAEVGPWYFDSLSIEVSDRVPGTNERARATAHVTFVRATEGSVKHGPLSTIYTSGHGTRLVAPNSKTYTVRKGDTLSSIAQKVYGDATVAVLLAAVNGIKHPRKQLKVGRVLKTPPLESTIYGEAHG